MDASLVFGMRNDTSPCRVGALSFARKGLERVSKLQRNTETLTGEHKANLCNKKGSLVDCLFCGVQCA